MLKGPGLFPYHNKPNPTLKTKEKRKNPIPDEGEKNTIQSIGNPKCPEENTFISRTL